MTCSVRPGVLIAPLKPGTAGLRPARPGVLLVVLLAASVRAQGALEPAQRLYIEGNLRGALLVAVEGLSESPGDAALARLQRLVLDDMLEAERTRLADTGETLRRRSEDRAVEVSNALDKCRRGNLAASAGDREWARTLYTWVRDTLPNHPCWRIGLANLKDATAPPDSPHRPSASRRFKPRKSQLNSRRPESSHGGSSPRHAAVRQISPVSEPVQEPRAPASHGRDPAAAHRAYLSGLSDYLRGRKVRARASLKAAVRLDPSHARAANLLKRLGREGKP